MSNYSKVYKELNEIFKYLPEEILNKTPLELKNKIKEEKDEEYEYEVTHIADFSNQEMLKETKAVLAILYRDYWADEEERREIIQQERKEYIEEEEKKKNQKLKDIFKEEKNIKENVSQAIIEYKEGFFKKTVIDLVDNKLDKIVLKDKENLPEIERILEEINASAKIEIDPDVLSKHSLEKQLKALKSNKIYLKGAYSRLKFESGVHRVQRVPDTESSGRIHTSAATVAVLPVVEDVEIEINPADIKMEVFRASGAGGQHVNKTSSAVRLIHEPTGIVVECQTERSQLQNREYAMKMLRSRLYNIEKEKQDSEIANARKTQVGSGDRSEKIRTYNYPQGRITDHRIGMSIFQMENFLNGDIDAMVDNLIAADRAERLKGEEE